MIKHEMENAFIMDVALEVEIGKGKKLVRSALNFRLQILDCNWKFEQLYHSAGIS